MRVAANYRVRLAPKNEGLEYQDQGESGRILPRVIGFLERVKWFGIFPRSYSVRVIDRPPK
jgi:hypothetical protein